MSADLSQEFIKALTVELEAENPKRFVQKTKETSVLMFGFDGRHLA